MSGKQYITRDGRPAQLIGPGPLSKNFLEFDVDGQRYLVWASSLRYRADFDSDGAPVPDQRDILEK